MSEQTLSPPKERVDVLPSPGRRSIWSFLLGNLWMSLGGLTGVMQAVAIQWWLVVALGGDGFGAFGIAVLGGSLCAANVVALPTLRRARSAGGFGRFAARLYIAVGIMTLLVGVAITVSWLGFASIAEVATWLGVGERSAWLGLRVGSVAVVLAVAGMVAWAFTGGQKLVDRSRVKIPIAGLHEDHRGLQVGHLTDLHIGNGLEGERLSKMVADFDPAYVEDGARRLGDLSARLGVYAVLGNHDTYTGTDEVVAAFAEHAPGIRLLRDEWVPLPLENPLYIAGIEDPGRGWTTRNLELQSMERVRSSGARCPTTARRCCSCTGRRRSTRPRGSASPSCSRAIRTGGSSRCRCPAGTTTSRS
jgi:hypothetical protein